MGKKIRGLRRCTQRDCKFVPLNRARNGATNIGTTGSPRENDTPVSEEAHMVERFHMVGEDEIIYEFTWTDPVVFDQPWSARLEWQRDDDYGMYEYACHEGNVQIRNYITASRAERAAEDASE